MQLADLLLGWSLAFIAALMVSRALNVFVIKQRASGSRKPALTPLPEPGVDTPDRWTEYIINLGMGQPLIRLRGLADDLQAVTGTKWLTDKTHVQGYMEAAAKLLVYLVAAFSGNMQQLGSI